MFRVRHGRASALPGSLHHHRLNLLPIRNVAGVADSKPKHILECTALPYRLIKLLRAPGQRPARSFSGPPTYFPYTL